MLSPKKTLALVFAIFFFGSTATVFWLRTNDSQQLSKEEDSFLESSPNIPSPQDAIPDPESKTSQTEQSEELPAAEKANLEKQQNIAALKGALKKEDESLCHSITAPSIRQECFDRIRLDAALHMQEVELCTAIEDTKLSTHCQESIIGAIAQKEKNSALCFQISQQQHQQECLQEVDREILFTAQSLKDCSQIQSAQERASCRDYFLFQEISLDQGEKTCEQFTSEEGKEKCEGFFLNHAAATLKDPTVCLQITDEQQQQECEAAMSVLIKKEGRTQGILAGKSSACRSFQNSSLREQCEDEANFYAAKLYKNPTYCEKIQNEEFAQDCQIKVVNISDEYWLKKAQQEQNQQYCSYVSDQKQQDSCQKNF